MEALTSCAPPPSNLCCINRRNDKLPSSRALIHFLRYPTNVRKSHSISLRFLNNSSEPLLSSFLSSTITQADVVSVDSVIEPYRSKTVHVKFQLQKECMFGEQFLLVGDDPILGLWEPSNAIPMDWSDEHIWRVDLDLPVGKSIQYKFLLKGATEEVFWQPGPDRILETWETKNIIVVFEDWENVEVQNITEEPWEENTPEAIDDVGVITAEEPMVNENLPSISTVCLEEESLEQTDDSFGAENILGKNGVVATEEVQDDNLVGCVGEPVLVPGLTPLSSTGEDVSSASKSNIVSHFPTVTGEAEEPSMPELCEPKDDQHDSGLQEKIQVTGEDDGTDHQAALHDTLQNDFTWGRKTLHKLLSTLGLTLDQT